MPTSRPNVLFLMADQYRGDCIGADPDCPTDQHGHPVVRTPNLSEIANEGVLFSNAHTPAPTCIPARKCLWTGQTPASVDATMNNHLPWDFEDPLPRVLRDAGYQTHLAGKAHSQPPGNHFGFEGIDRHSANQTVIEEDRDDYIRWLDRQTDGISDEEGHGLDFARGIDARPWHLEERLHPTNWTTDRAIDFLEQRDPTRPFFLTVSYVRPHTPFDPPQAYWDQYVDRDLPDPVLGDWVADIYGDADPPSPEFVHRVRAGYYAMITHLDHQINRLFRTLGAEGIDDTLVVMTSDHGEMLGDHARFFKNCAYEGATRIPLLLGFPDSWNRGPVDSIDRPVGLEDVMPTVLDAVGVDVPDTVEGRTLLDLVDDPDRGDWRSAYHGEWGPSNEPDTAQYLVDESTKYIWNPITDDELLFDLSSDPLEETNLAGDADREADRRRWRDRLADRLADRQEGFVVDGELTTVDAAAWEPRYE